MARDNSRRLRWIGVPLTVAATIVSLVGCTVPGSAPTPGSQGSAGEGKGVVEFWDSNANPTLTPLWQKFIAEFNESQDDVEVTYTGLPVSSYLQKVETAIATGEVPDVMLVGNDVAGFIAQGALEPLDERLTSTGLAEEIVPAHLDTERQNSPDGLVYKTPLTALSEAMWLRTDWLREAGLSQPTTWDEFFNSADKLTDPSSNRFGWTFRGGTGGTAPLFAFMFGKSGVGEFFDKDGKARLDDPSNVEALKEYISLFTENSAQADITNDYTRIVAAFGGGSAWATQHNLGSYGDHVKNIGADNVVGLQPFPVDGKVTAIAPAIGGLSIMRESDNKDAAFKFIEFMLSTDVNSRFSEAVSQVPSNEAAGSAEWISVNQPISEIVRVSKLPGSQYVQLPTYLPEYGTITKTEMEPDIQALLQGQIAAEDFLAKYSDRFTGAYKAFKERG